MVSVRNYLITNFIKSFLLVFLPFLMIVSLVYLVKVSALTSQVELSLKEFLTLFGYTIPSILFYTMPFSYIAALTNTLLRLSNDNELISLYALGLNAHRLLLKLFPISLLLSLLLLTLSFFAIPINKQLYTSFKIEKKAEAKLNIVPGKLGQKFGDFYVYVKEKEDNGTFKHIVIYNRTNGQDEQFFASDKGELLNNKNGHMSLKLQHGYGYTYNQTSLQQAQYQTLEVFDSTKFRKSHIINLVSYLKQAQHDTKTLHLLLFFAFISLLPILALYPVAAFSMINPRYQGSHSLLITFFVTLPLYIIAVVLKTWGTPSLLIASIITTFFVGFILFKKRVARYF